jgi:VWFA-related protein
MGPRKEQTMYVGRSRIHAIALLMSLSALVLLPVSIGKADTGARLTINYIETEPVPEEVAYQVRAYVTVSDEENLPVTRIDGSRFSAREDAKEIEIDAVETAVESMSVLLLLDTSGSMLSQGKWPAAQEAADKFVENLSAGDQVAVLIFNEELSLRVDFTDDHNAARNEIAQASAVSGKGTCLYDAAYEAIKRMSGVPPGRRALILLTDGIDETMPGEICSDMTFDDVVEKATAVTTRVPLYTVGLGVRVDAQEMARLAELTGGRSLVAPGAEELLGLFDTIADQLKNQYVISYKSTGVSGEHSLAVAVDHQGVVLQDERAYFAPSIPPTVEFIFPGPDDSIEWGGTIRPTVKVTSQGNVSLVKFYVNEKLEAEINSPPYSFEWDTAGLESGQYALRAEVYDVEGKKGTDELQLSITVPPTPTPAPTSTPTASPTPIPDESVESNGSIWPLFLVVGVAGLFVFGIVMYLRRRRTRKEDQLWDEEQFLQPDLEPLDVETQDIMGETRDVSESLSDPLATLTVERSLELDVGRQFDLFGEPTTTIGRHADSDVVVPDQPVSRWHGEIIFEAGEFRIYDVGSKYGTKVNGESVPRDGTPLKDGDEIRLGTRTVLRFHRHAWEEPIDEGAQQEEPGDDFETKDVGDLEL